MKQARITGPRQAGLMDVADPVPKANWVKVKVMAAPMCTEVKGFVKGDGSHGYGHEAAGEVVETAQPCRVKPGDRVVVQPGTPCGVCALCLSGDFIHCEKWVNFEAFTGSKSGLATMAQYLLKPDWLLSPIPDGMSYDLASLAICGLGPTFGAMERMRVEALDTVLISGLGAVGLGGVVNASFRGARVIGVEANAYRAALAKELGAEVVLNPADPDILPKLMALTNGAGIPKAIDCSGVVAAHTLCLEAAARRGEVAFVGQCWEPTPLPVSPCMIKKGLTLHGVWHYKLHEYFKLIEVLRKSPAAPKLITHTFPLSRVRDAWETQVSGLCGKVILHPWE